MKAKSTHQNMNSDLSVTCLRIENMLIEWIWKMYRNEIFLMDDVIQEKAKHIQAACNRRMHSAQRTHLRFCNRWLYRFQKTERVRGWNSHGESGDADEEAISTELTLLRTLLSAFLPKDTFNADEFSLF